MTLPHLHSVPGTMPLVLRPPFRSSRLSMSYLPLRADLGQLTRICDQYLNLPDPTDGTPGLPDEVGVFRPRLPLVYLIVADHPRLESLTDKTYLVQHELAFSIPVEVHRRQQGRWRFDGYAFTQPFIFIDSPLGMTTGRLVWGWPKAMATFESKAGWAEGQGRLRMSMPELEGETLISIGRRRAPARGGLSMIGPWGEVYASMMRDLYSSWLDPRGALDRMEVLWRELARLPTTKMDIVTLEQFPSFDGATFADHQAIVRSSARITRVHGLSLLGAERQALGELSGGLCVDIAQHASQPIVELLGLQPTRTSRDSTGRTIASFEPIMPFRSVIDADYDAGEVLCWRGLATPWHRGHTDPDVETSPFDPLPRLLHTLNAYSMARGPAIQVQEHPRELGGLRLVVYPLATIPDPKRLRRLCADCLGIDAARLEIAEPYVYLVTARATAGSLGSVSLCVRVSITDAKGQRLTGVVIPFEHSSSGLEAITNLEYAGRRMMPAELRWREAPEDGPRLALRAELAPELGAGRRAESLPILTIDDHAGPDEPHPRDEPGWWQTRSAEHLAANVLTLVQFPHAKFVDRACVQTRISMRHELRPRGTLVTTPSARVIFYDYPSQSLVDLLDLADAASVEPGARSVRVRSPLAVEVDLHMAPAEHWTFEPITPDGSPTSEAPR